MDSFSMFDSCVVDYDYYKEKCEEKCKNGECVNLDIPLDFYEEGESRSENSFICTCSTEFFMGENCDVCKG